MGHILQFCTQSDIDRSAISIYGCEHVHRVQEFLLTKGELCQYIRGFVIIRHSANTSNISKHGEKKLVLNIDSWLENCTLNFSNRCYNNHNRTDFLIFYFSIRLNDRK